MSIQSVSGGGTKAHLERILDIEVGLLWNHTRSIFNIFWNIPEVQKLVPSAARPQGISSYPIHSQDFFYYPSSQNSLQSPRSLEGQRAILSEGRKSSRIAPVKVDK